MLWTFVFTAVGIKILNNRNLLQSQKAEVIAYCTKCGLLGRYSGGSTNCPKCKQKLEVTTITMEKWENSSKKEKQYLLDSWGVKKHNVELVAISPRKKQTHNPQLINTVREKQVMLFCPKCDCLWRFENVSNGICPTCKGKLTNTGISPKAWFELNDKEKASLADGWRSATAKCSASTERKESSFEKANTPTERAISPTNKTVLFCRKCGARIPADSAYCQKCGEKVIHVE